jgi:hypothetical protein
VRDGPAGLLAVDVPAGRHVLEVDFRSPGLSVGAAAVAVAALLSLGQSAVPLVAGRWRRARHSGVPPRTEDPGAPLGPGDDDERRGDVVPAGTSGR